MGISGSRVRQLLRVTLLSLILLAGFLRTGKAAKPGGAKPQVPEAFRQLEARVLGLRFYATQTSREAPMPARVYTTNFIRGDTHYIWWELRLEAKAKRDKPVRLFIKAIWQRPDGTEFKQGQAVSIPANFQHPCFSGRWGYAESGGWLPGSYRVMILIDDIPVVRGFIEVFEKLLQGE